MQRLNCCACIAESKRTYLYLKNKIKQKYMNRDTNSNARSELTVRDEAIV